MKAKFSKGIWLYIQHDSIVYDGDGNIVCDTMSTGEVHEESNAHLIAAAPDMYMTLHALMETHKEVFGNDKGAIIEHIEKLLKKARGE